MALAFLWQYPKMEGEEQQTDNVELVKRMSNLQNHGRNSACKRISDGFVERMEALFVRFGTIVGKHPCKIIFISIGIALLFGIGMIKFNMDGSPLTLWTPTGSDFKTQQTWVDTRFPSKSRIASIIVEDENVLSKTSFIKLLEIHRRILSINNGSEYDFQHLCFRRGGVCVTYNILQILEINEMNIQNMTDEDIISKINQLSSKGWNGKKFDVKTVTGNIIRNNTGHIIAAKAILSLWMLKSVETFSKQTGFATDTVAEKWEKRFAELLQSQNFGFINIAFLTRSSQNNSADKAMQSDVFILSAGYIVMVIYASLMLGKFNRLRQKIWLGSIAVFCVILSILVSCGISSCFGLPYGPLHNILPFLILGIGVDDAFVIAQSWEIFREKFKSEAPIHFLAGQTMKHAGVSITVTSFTDFIAFVVGATTILPALRSFCIYSGLAILALYFLSCTIFLACLSLDTTRERNHRDACFCCIKLKDDFVEPPCSRKNFIQRGFDFFGNHLLSKPLNRISVLIITICLFAVSCFAVSKLKQEYRFEWWLPANSSPRKYIAAKSKYFPAKGLQTAVFIDNVDHFKENAKLIHLCQQIKNGKYIVKSSVVCWLPVFVSFAASKKNFTLEKGKIFTNRSQFNSLLQEFVKSKFGLSYSDDIVFSQEDGKARNIVASRFRANHKDVHTSQDETRAMDEIKDIANSIHFTNGKAFAFAEGYLYFLWEANKVIKRELFRNLGLASAAVFLVTLLMVANLWMSIMIFTCIVLTLTNVAGFMHFWGLTIETVTSVCLLLSVGLSIDYSAHIGHSFMTSSKSTRQERAADAISNIGPAVFNGGFSTFLAFAFLAFSNSYGFKTFFKVFLLVVLFGLFHGLIFLPVLSSFIGPAPYKTSSNKIENDEVKKWQEIKFISGSYMRGFTVSGSFKNNISVVLHQCQNEVDFQRMDYGIVSKFSPHFLKGEENSNDGQLLMKEPKSSQVNENA